MTSENFVELADADELTEFLNKNEGGCVITFSATWCGPCKRNKPELMNEIAPKAPVPIGYVYEEDIEDFLQVFIEIKAFPTYVYFKNGQETARVQGADHAAMQQMMLEQSQQS